mgnify:CR=1 FL=1
MPKNRSLVALPEAASYLSTSERHIRTLVYRRAIPHHKLGGRLRFDLAELDQMLDQGRVEVV